MVCLDVVLLDWFKISTNGAAWCGDLASVFCGVDCPSTVHSLEVIGIMSIVLIQDVSLDRLTWILLQKLLEASFHGVDLIVIDEP